jgi:hypothetical protein
MHQGHPSTIFFITFEQDYATNQRACALCPHISGVLCACTEKIVSCVYRRECFVRVQERMLCTYTSGGLDIDSVSSPRICVPHIPWLPQQSLVISILLLSFWLPPFWCCRSSVSVYILLQPILSSDIMSFPVSLISYAGAPRLHQAIFLDTEANGDGQLFHTKGSILNGQVYKTRRTNPPQRSLSFVSKELLGTISISDYSQIFTVCADNPPPAKQYDGLWRINPKVPLRTCQEWAQESIQTLRDCGILQ